MAQYNYDNRFIRMYAEELYARERERYDKNSLLNLNSNFSKVECELQISTWMVIRRITRKEEEVVKLRDNKICIRKR